MDKGRDSGLGYFCRNAMIDLHPFLFSNDADALQAAKKRNRQEVEGTAQKRRPRCKNNST